MKNQDIDTIIESAIDSLPLPDQQKIYDASKRLAERVSSQRGARGFGETRARELLFRLACWLNNTDST
jgi:hypothetical protein